MTIGIGVLCSSKPRPHLIRPDGLVLVADTMGSTDTDSTAELHKLVIENNLYMALAGDIALASDVGSIIKKNVDVLSQRTHGLIWDAINKAVIEALQVRFAWDVLAPKYMFAQNIIFDNERQKITKDWEEYDPDLLMLVGTFLDTGLAVMYLVGRVHDSQAWVHLSQYPGHAAIGTGGTNANFWLRFRGQQLGLSPKQSVYHAYESKVMAAKAPTVKDNVEMIMAFADRHYLLTAERPAPEGCPVSLTELRSMYLKYGPQNTHELRPSAHRRSYAVNFSKVKTGAVTI